MGDALATLVSVLTTSAYQPVLEALQGDGPFTVFAPTNDAFAAAGVDVTDVETVTEVLQYHVVAGVAASSTSLSRGQRIETLQGDKVTVSKSWGKIYIDDAKVVVPDVLCSNGIVHVIDEVLLPTSISGSAKSCEYMGIWTEHGAKHTGPTLTCLCDDGRWVDCVDNEPSF